VLSIPIYPELEREMQDWVVSAISEFLGIETPVEE
jgi:dTDP-4-amino-4,6-dideoxygalactose transaminase